MNHDIRLIGLDLDGTVFNDAKHITNRTIDAIIKAIEKGVIVIPATGRPLNGLPQEFLSIPGVNYALTSNGSSIYDFKKKEVIYSDLIDISNAIKVIEAAQKFDSIVDVFLDGSGYTSKNNLELIHDYIPSAPLADYVLNTRHFFEGNLVDFILQINKPIEKIHMLFKSMDEKQAAICKMQEFPNITVTSALPNNLEITTATANKGNGLYRLGKLLGIDKDQIMACGDSGNDIEMIKLAGVGVAMGNATKEVKDIADYITSTNEEDGVAKAIEKYVLSK